MDISNSEWFKQEDPLVQGAYHTVQAVIEERDKGNPEPYHQLLDLLMEFATRRRDILVLGELFGKEDD